MNEHPIVTVHSSRTHPRSERALRSWPVLARWVLALAALLVAGTAWSQQIREFTPRGGRSQPLQIVGSGFTGATAVKFNGTPALGFTVVSDTIINATSPATFTTGPITVERPGGTLTSPNYFISRPAIVSLIGPVYPAPGGSTVNVLPAANTGAISRASGTTMQFSNMPRASTTTLLWGAQPNGVRLSMNGSSFEPNEVLQYESSLSNLPNGTVVYTGSTNLPEGGAVATRFTMQFRTFGGAFPLPVTSVAPFFIPSGVGAVFAVRPGTPFEVNLRFDASYSFFGGFIPALDFYDVESDVPTPLCFSSFDGDFWWEDTAPEIAPINNVLVQIGTPVPAVPLSIIDVETGPQGPSGFNSNNAFLLPNAAISLSGSPPTQSIGLTPVAGRSGITTISVLANDGVVPQSVRQFTLTVNAPPTIGAIPDQVVQRNGSSAAIAFAVSDDITPAGSLVLSHSALDPALIPPGGVSFGGSGGARTVTITPAPGLSGTTTVTITVTDAFGAAASEDFTVQVNAPPNLNFNLTTFVDQGASQLVDGATLHAIDNESPPSQLVYRIASGPGGGPPHAGQLKLNGAPLFAGATFTQAQVDANQLTYEHNDSCNKFDDFQFDVSDGQGGFAPRPPDPPTFSHGVLVTLRNDPPTAGPGSYSIGINGNVSGQANGSDGDCLVSDTLVFSVVGTPTLGTVDLDPATGAFTFHAGGSTGTGGFDYSVSDGTTSASAHVTVSVQNQQPVGLPGSATTSEGAAVVGTASASDPDSYPQPLTFAIATNGAKGSAVFTNPATGEFTYTPNPGRVGIDSFTFTANDGVADSAPAVVTVVIKPVLAVGDIVVTNSNQSGPTPIGSVVFVDPSTGDQALIATGGNLKDPRGVAVSENRTIYVADAQTGLLRIDPASGAQTVITGLPGFPLSIAFDRAGALIVAQGPAGVTRRNPADGSVIDAFSHPLITFAAGVDVGPDNTIYVSSGGAGFPPAPPGSLLAIADDLAHTITPLSTSGLTLPVALTYRTPGQLLIGDGAFGLAASRVMSFDLAPPGTLATYSSDPLLGGITGIDSTPGGTVYGASNDGGAVFRLPGGAPIPVTSGGFLTHPFGLAVVQQNPTTTVLISPETPSAIVSGQAFSATIEVTGIDPTGDVTVAAQTLGGVTVVATCSGTLGGSGTTRSAECSFPAGSVEFADAVVRLVAHYPGEATGNDGNSDSSPWPISVTKGEATLGGSIPGDEFMVGEPVLVTITASANSPATGALGDGTPDSDVTVTAENGTSCGVDLDAGQSSCTVVFNSTGDGPVAPKSFVVGKTGRRIAVPKSAQGISASYDGNDNFSASVSPTTIATPDVTPANTNTVLTTAGLTSGTDPSPFGDQVVLSAAVTNTVPGATTAPTGEVLFSDEDDNVLGSVSLGAPVGATSYATLTILAPPVGTANYEAFFNTTDDFVGSDDNDAHTVDGADTEATIFDFSPSSPLALQPTTVSVRVTRDDFGTGSPTGSVLVSGDDGGSCTAALAPDGPNASKGSCQLTFATKGTKPVSAVYAGNAQYNASSDSDSIVVQGIPTTIAVTSTVPNPSYYGNSFTVNFQITGGAAPYDGDVLVSAFPAGDSAQLGAMKAFFGGGSTCTTVAPTGTGSCVIFGPLPVGSWDIVAQYAGDATDAAGTSAPFPHEVVQATTSATLSGNPPPPGPVPAGATVTASVALALANGNGPITGTVNVSGTGTSGCSTPAAAGVVTCDLFFTTTGSQSIAATFVSSDPNVAGATSNSLGYDVETAATSIVVDLPPPSPQAGEPYAFTFDVNGGFGTYDGGIQFELDGLPFSCQSFSFNPTNGLGNCTIPGQLLQQARSYAVRVRYLGDPTDTASEQTATLAVVRRDTSASLTIAPPGSQFAGQGVTFQVVVAALGGIFPTESPTGPAYVCDAASGPCNAGNAVCTVALAPAGPATTIGTCPASFLVVGPRVFVAAYEGNPNFNPSLSPPTPYTIDPAPTTTIITTNLVPPTLVGQPLTVSFDVNGGADSYTGVVTVTATLASPATTVSCNAPTNPVDGTGACVLTGPSSLLHVGSWSITAAYGGDPNDQPSASGASSHPVVPAPTTTLLASGPVDPTVFGQPIVLTATVTANAPSTAIPTGTVEFFDGVTSLGTFPLIGGQAQRTGILRNVGTYSFRATYNVGGVDPDFLTSVDTDEPHQVVAASATLALADAPDPTVAGEFVTYTASLGTQAPGAGPPTGSVTITANPGGFTCVAGPLAPTGPSSSSASCQIQFTQPGTYNAAGTYDNTDGNFTDIATPSGGTAHLVNRAPATITIGAIAPPSPAQAGTTITVPFAVTGGFGGSDGLVDISATNGPTTVVFCTQVPVAAGSCAAQLDAPGTWTISASYNTPFTDTNDTADTDTAGYVIQPAGTTLTVVVTNTPPIYAGQTVTIEATLAETSALVPSGAITVTQAGNPVCTITLPATTCTASFNVAATLVIVASYPGDTFFAPSSDDFTFDVLRALTNTEITAISPGGVVVGEPVTVSFQVGGRVLPDTGTVDLEITPPGSVTCDDVALNAVGDGQCTFTVADAGPHTLVARYSGDANDEPSNSGAAFLSVTQAATSLTIAQVPPTQPVGQPVTFTATLSVTAPGAGTPDGFVWIRDTTTSTNLCSIAAAAASAPAGASCQHTFTTIGTKSVAAFYDEAESDDYLGSTSATITHEALPAPTTLTITAITPAPSNAAIGNPVTVAYQLSGGFGPTFDGTIVVSATRGATTVSCPSPSFDDNRDEGGDGACTFPATAFQLAGTWQFTASFVPGPSADDGPSSDTDPYDLQKGASVTTLLVTPASQQYAGATITFAASVAPAQGTVTTQPTGSIEIVYGGNVLCTITQPSTLQQCQSHIDFPDVFEFEARYLGDANFLADSDFVDYEIVRAPTTTTVTADTPDPSVTGQPVAVSFTVTGGVAPLSGDVIVDVSNGTFSYQCQASVATGTCTVTPLHTGNYNVVAYYEGDVNDADSTSAPVPHVVDRATTTTTLVVVPTPSSEIGTSITLTATVTANAPGGGIPQGQFEFFDGATAINLTALNPGGQATFTTSSLSLGTHTLRGVFTSTADYVGSNGDQAHTILPASTTTSITVAPIGPNARIGESVTASFDVEGGFGPGYEGTVTVTATDGTHNATCAPVSFNTTRPGGTGTCTFAQTAFQFAGPWTFTATFVPGAGSDDAGSSGSTSYALRRGTSVTTLTISPPGTQETGATVTFSATVVAGDGDVSTTPTGIVTVQDGPLVICTITLPGTSCTSVYNQPATLSVTATYESDANFDGSITSAQAYTIVRADTSTTVTAIAPPSVVVGQSFTTSFDVDGQVTPDVGPAGTVSLVPTPSGSPFCGPTSLAPDGTGSCTAVRSSAGTFTYTAEYAGDSNDLPSSSAIQTIVVSEAATALTLAQSTSTSTVGDSVAFTAQLSVLAPGAGTPTGTIVVSAPGIGTLCTIDAANALASGGASCSYPFGSVGTFSVTATYADSEDPNFLGATSNTLSHDVTAAPTTTIITSITSPTALRIGEPITVSFQVTGGFGPTFDGTVTVTAEPGTIACVPVTFNATRPTGTGSCTFPASTFQLSRTTDFTAAFVPSSATSDDAASQGSQSALIDRAITTATLMIAPPSTQVVGQVATFNVAVAVDDPDVTTTPTGTITVYDQLTYQPICSFPLPGPGSCQHVFDFPASLQVVADYSGDANFVGDITEAQPYTITKAPTSVAITGVVRSPSVAGETVTISYQVTGGHLGNDGTVTIDTGPAALSCNALATTGSCAITFATAGTYSLTASYSGDDNDLPSTTAAPTTHVVDQAATTLSLQQSAAVAQIGQSVDFTVDLDIVAPGAGVPGGNIVVFYGSTTICSIPAASALDGETCSHVFTALGTVEVAAVYEDGQDPNFGPSSADVSHETIAADTSTTITAITPAGVRIGDPVTVAFQVTGGYGPTFDGTVAVSASNGATCSPVSFTGTRPTGTGSCTFAAGAFQLAGTYDFTVALVPGAGSDDAASSDTDSFAIDRGTTTTTLTVTPPGSQVAGSTVTFTATVARNDVDVTTTVTGTVAILDDGTPVCTITLPATSCATSFPIPRTLFLVASYSGDANFEGSSSSEQEYLIDYAPTTTTITADAPDPTVTGEPFTVGYAVAGGFDGNDGNVTVTATGPATYTCTASANTGACTITPFKAGSYALTATYAGDANDAGSTTAGPTPHIVNRATTTLAFTVVPSPQIFGDTVTLTATVTSNAPGSGVPVGTVVFLDNGASFAEVPLNASGVAVFTTSSFAIGTHPLRADFAQTADYLQSFFDVSHEVLRYPTTTAITSDAPDPSVTGQPVLVQFTVSTTNGTPTGNVTVTATPGGQTCVATVAAGQCSLTFASAVPRTLVASYEGDALHQPSTSANEPHTVNKAATATTITSDSPDPSDVNQPYTVAVTVAAAAPGAGTPSGTVAVSDGTDGCSITLAGGSGSCSMASTVPGSKTLTATYSGNADFNGGSGTTPHEVLRIVTTTTLAPPAAVVVGQPATFVWSVTAVDGSPPTGAVTILDTAGPTTVCTASVAAGQCQAPFTSAGARTVRADYAGDTTHAPSSSATQTLTVNKAATTTTITSDTPDPSEVTTPYTVAASVAVTAPGAGTPTGTITVSDGTDSCTITLPAPSCALTSTTLGSKTLTATYAGDTNFNGSSGTATHEVVKIATTTTITSATPAPSVSGQAVAFAYTVATGTGTATGNVTVTAAPSGESCTGTVAAGQCTITFATAGNRTLTAAYAGDATHATSTSASFAHTVNRASTTTTVTSDTPDPSQVGQPYTVSVSVAASAPGAGTPGGSVAVSDGTDGCSITLASGSGSCSLTSTTAGAKTLTATYAGDANFAGSSGTAAHQVNAMTTTTTLNVAPASVVVGQAVTFTYTVTPATGAAPTGTVTVVDTGTSATVCSGTVAAGQCTASFANVGTYNVRANYGGDATHATSQSAPQAVTVAKAATTITITSDTPDPSAVNSAYTVVFSLTVNAPGAGTPTGIVTVSDGSASCTATLPATSCALTSTTVGAKTLSASYAGDTNFIGSTDTESHDVVQITTTTTIASDLPDPSVVGQAVTIAFTVAPATAAGNVTVTASTGEGCSATIAVGQCTITFTSSGPRTLTAAYAGNTNHAGSTSAAEPHTVNAAATTTTIVSDTPDPSEVDQAVTYAVTVATSAPGAGTATGSVTVGPAGETCTASLTGGSGSCSITYTTAGARSVTATYGGSANFAASTSAAISHTVGTRGTVVSILSDTPDRSTPTQPVTVTVSFGLDDTDLQGTEAPTGSITISDGVDNCQIALPATSCTLTLTTRGPRTLTATYPGDANYDPSSDTEAHLVNRLPATIADSYVTPQGVGLNANDATGAGTPGNANDNGALANDTDADSDALTVTNAGSLTAGGIGGSVTLNSNGTFTYVPPAATAGTATFPVQVSDGYETVTAGVTITVQGLVDLAISKTNGQGLTGFGDTVTYTIVVSNIGGSAVSSAIVRDILPASLTNATWTCAGTGGAVCPASGTGNIDRLVDLPVASSVTFTLTATVAPTFTGLLSNSVTVDPPSGQVDSAPANNTATDSDDVRTFRDGYESP